ncbi:MAG: SBBP repeat-containing protein [Bacteroidetes bacterium]|nr:SBBP repeat-containing protein [Bacteroidota bacterium]MBL0096937.1 SBBP repeat-containing protein [Bacteroidota bacterium]
MEKPQISRKKTQSVFETIYLIALAIVLFNTNNFAQTPGWNWAKGGSGSFNENPGRIATDNSGNVYVAGSFASTTIAFDAITLTNAGSSTSDLFIVKYDPNGNVIWAKSAGGLNSDQATGIAIDSNNNVCIAGSFESSSLTFGPISITNNSIGSHDIFLAKFDSLGNIIWAKRAGGSVSDFCNGIATDGNGNILITGSYASPLIAFGSTVFTNPGSMDLYVAKYDNNGNVIWARSHGGSDWDTGLSIKADISGNVFVTGYFKSSAINFGSISLTNSTGNSFSDLFIVKYDINGIVQWAKNPQGTANESGNDIATDVNGNVYITGYYQSATLDFDTITITNNSPSYYDSFTAKYDNNGNVSWANTTGGTFPDVGNGISLNTNGDVYVAGYFESPSISIGNNTLFNSGSSDIFILKFSNNGAPQWGISTGGTSQDLGNHLAISISGEIYLTGIFQSTTVPFGSTTLTNAGFFDVWTAKLSELTGIHENSHTATFLLSPNPASNQFSINLNGSFEKSEIQITDITGKEVYRHTFFENNALIVNTGGLADGLYTVTITTRAFTGSRKLIIQKK